MDSIDIKKGDYFSMADGEYKAILDLLAVESPQTRNTILVLVSNRLRSILKKFTKH